MGYCGSYGSRYRSYVKPNLRPYTQPASAEGSTSGLHHDYHDNIYVLLRGHKTFRLYSPADAPRCVQPSCGKAASASLFNA